MPVEFWPLIVVGAAVVGGLHVLSLIVDRKREASDLLDGYEHLLENSRHIPPDNHDGPPLVR